MSGAALVMHSEEGMKSILDPSFRYTKSVDTDIRKTFARVRRELGLRTPSALDGVSAKVLPFKQRRRAVAM